jgi:YebC/PmpR family DNA-binding regulatory protein
MSGHSKWSTIKHKKAAADAKRGKVFTRLAKEITVAAREGGGDLDVNVRLRLVVDKVKAVNMPKDNIDRAIKRGTGELEGGELYEYVYEAYGPHGIGIIIETVTDNKNRAIAELRHVLNKYGGAMAEAGAVVWQFTRKGYIGVTGDPDQDEIFLVAADAGAEDIRFDEDMAEIFTELEQLQSVRTALDESGFELDEVSVIYDPNNAIELAGDEAVQVLRLVEYLEELDDVQNVYTALDINDEAMTALEMAA